MFHLNSFPRLRFVISSLLYFSLIFLLLSIRYLRDRDRYEEIHVKPSILIDQRDLDDAHLKPLANQQILGEEFFQSNDLLCRAPKLPIDSREMWQFLSLVNETKPKCSSTPNWIEISKGSFVVIFNR